MKFLGRLLMLVNVVFWLFFLWFPIAKFFSIPAMRTLSHVVAGLCLLFIVSFALIMVLLYKQSRQIPALKWDARFAALSFAVNILLVCAVGGGYL